MIQENNIQIIVEPGIADPIMCKLSATGTKMAEVNKKTSFFVQARDRYGNIRYSEEDQFIATLNGRF